MIDLGYGIGTTIDLVHAPFAAGAETRTYSDRLTTSIGETRHDTLL
jgi:hypothetical protein